MLINVNDFKIQLKNFDLTRTENILRIMCGAFLFPHAASKFTNGGLTAGTIVFFEKVGFVPGNFWVSLAAFTEITAGIALILGLCTRFAALGAAATLVVAAYALYSLNGFGWLWNKGGDEYLIFWAICCILVSINAFRAYSAQQ